MNSKTIYDKEFKGIDYSENNLPKREYENCNFTNCIFSNTDLSEIVFSECLFENCDFSMSDIKDTAFKEVKFKSCKLLGMRFEECKKFLLSFSFEDCILNFASFYQLKIKGTIFKNCILQEADFSGTDLSEAIFINCNLDRTIFENTILEKADFRTSHNYSIDPEINKIRKAKFSKEGIAGLLDKYNIEIE